MIPKIIHFIFGLKEDFNGMPFSLVHYIAVKSAYEVNKPIRIHFYFKHEPQGFFWEKAKKYLHLIPVVPPEEIFGNPIYHPAHQADVLRLLILIKYGGIYLDLDTICIRPFDDLLQHRFVIGQQGTGFCLEGLSNAVMLAEKNSQFLSTWLSNYKNFRSKGRDAYWDEHSVHLPLQLSPLFCRSDALHIEPYTSFHFPDYQVYLKQLFEGSHHFPKAYCHHLWESISWHPYLKELSVDKILSGDAYYHRVARRFIKENYGSVV